MTPYYFMRLFFLGAVLAGFALPAQALAQENLPSLSMNPRDMREAGPSGFSGSSAPVFSYPNQYLNDTLSLQYQNVLLEKMILRQGNITRTEKSFLDVGVPFNQPAPPRGICEQIPVNVPCYRAYPDLYPGAVEDVSESGDETLDIGQLAIEAAYVPPIAEAPPPLASAAADSGLSLYKWAEIMCAAGRCTAVVTNGSTRQTVREGDTIGDGVKIVRISATGVDAAKGAKREALRSALAPSRGGMASPKFTDRSGGSARRPDLAPSQDSGPPRDLEALFSSTTPAMPSAGSAMATPETTAAVPAPSPSGPVDDPGPPLGPTGLF